ncbi:MAG: PPC domain-containing protein [Phycisphaerales bacterium]
MLTASHVPATVATASSLAVCTTLAIASGGDDPSTATEIPSLPFASSGDTSALTDQFDAVCPFEGSTSPDAWYQFTANEEVVLEIDLCESFYDTKVYVLDADFNEIACNDDACGGSFRSELLTPELAAGTYFLVVDGWSGESGTYDLMIEASPQCVIVCPAGSVQENELCDDEGNIDTNGGCDAPIFVIDDVQCGDTVCGQAWALNGVRDTDWYRLAPLILPAPACMTATAGFPCVLVYFGENPTCDTIAPVLMAETTECGNTESLVAVPDLSSETWWMVAPIGLDLLPCGTQTEFANDYVVGWECDPGPPPGPCPQIGDSNFDGVVDFNDLMNVLNNYGSCP